MKSIIEQILNYSVPFLLRHQIVSLNSLFSAGIFFAQIVNVEGVELAHQFLMNVDILSIGISQED
jgi:hypothetical protein